MVHIHWIIVLIKVQFCGKIDTGNPWKSLRLDENYGEKTNPGGDGKYGEYL